MQTLREIDNSFPDICDRTVTLILVPEEGEPEFAITKSDKREMLLILNDYDVIIAVWTGKWRSDAFEVTDKTLRKWRDEIGVAKRHRR